MYIIIYVMFFFVDSVFPEPSLVFPADTTLRTIDMTEMISSQGERSEVVTSESLGVTSGESPLVLTSETIRVLSEYPSSALLTGTDLISLYVTREVTEISPYGSQTMDIIYTEEVSHVSQGDLLQTVSKVTVGELPDLTDISSHVTQITPDLDFTQTSDVTQSTLDPVIEYVSVDSDLIQIPWSITQPMNTARSDLNTLSSYVTDTTGAVETGVIEVSQSVMATMNGVELDLSQISNTSIISRSSINIIKDSSPTDLIPSYITVMSSYVTTVIETMATSDIQSTPDLSLSMVSEIRLNTISSDLHVVTSSVTNVPGLSDDLDIVTSSATNVLGLSDDLDLVTSSVTNVTSITSDLDSVTPAVTPSIIAPSFTYMTFSKVSMATAVMSSSSDKNPSSASINDTIQASVTSTVNGTSTSNKPLTITSFIVDTSDIIMFMTSDLDLYSVTGHVSSIASGSLVSDDPVHSSQLQTTVASISTRVINATKVTEDDFTNTENVIVNNTLGINATETVEYQKSQTLESKYINTMIFSVTGTTELIESMATFSYFNGSGLPITGNPQEMTSSDGLPITRNPQEMTSSETVGGEFSDVTSWMLYSTSSLYVHSSPLSVLSPLPLYTEIDASDWLTDTYDLHKSTGYIVTDLVRTSLSVSSSVNSESLYTESVSRSVLSSSHVTVTSSDWVKDASWNVEVTRTDDVIPSSWLPSSSVPSSATAVINVSEIRLWRLSILVQEVLLAQYSLCVKIWPKTHSFFFIFWYWKQFKSQ